MKKDNKLYYTVFTSIRNRACYLKEWVDFHLLTGAEKIFIVDFASQDSPEEVLKPYIDKKQVFLKQFREEEVWTFRASLKEQKRARPEDTYEIEDRWFEMLTSIERGKFIDSFWSKITWTAFLDIDEFLFPTQKDTTMVELLKNYEEFPGVGVNWIVFGSNGKEFYEDDYVIKRFTKRAPLDDDVNLHIKTICQLSQVDLNAGTTPLGLRNQHFFFYASNRMAVNENKEPIMGPSTMNLEESKIRPSQVFFRLNHYHYMSTEEYAQKNFQGWVAGQEKERFVNKIGGRTRAGIDPSQSPLCFSRDGMEPRMKIVNKEEDKLILRYLPELEKLNVTPEEEKPLVKNVEVTDEEWIEADETLKKQHPEIYGEKKLSKKKAKKSKPKKEIAKTKS